MAGHLFGLDGLSVRGLSEGMIFGRKLAVEYMEFYRKYVPGCERIELAATSPVMGVRDTRRIVGEFELTTEDLQRGHGNSPIRSRSTIVPPTCTRPTPRRKSSSASCATCTASGKLPRGKCLGIPYSILVPKGCENLWIAGRCHSSDTKVHGSIRSQSAAFLMGRRRPPPRCSRCGPASRPAISTRGRWSRACAPPARICRRRRSAAP